MTKATILSIQVGMPRALGLPGSDDPHDQPWESSIFKERVEGPIRLGAEGLAGNGQADLKAHGGPNQAVLFYAAAHYPFWRAALDRPDLDNGGFGENFTVAGLTEREACVGDRIAVGEVVVEVSQPRQPCWKLSRRHRVDGLADRVREENRGGWYVRVLREGLVEAGQELLLVERPYPEWTIARVNDVIHRRERDPAARAALAACPALSERWRVILSKPARDED